MSENLDSGEQSVELTRLMVEFSNALASTTEAMDNAFATRPELKNRDVIYQIPRMSVSVKMSLSMSQGKIISVLGLVKNQSGRSEEVVSTVNLDFVAVPRSGSVLPRRLLGYTVPMTKGEDVRVLQMKLMRYAQNYDSSIKLAAADGEFGTGTREAVIKFQQKQRSSKVDGVVDDETYEALLKFAPDPSSSYVSKGKVETTAIQSDQ